MTTFAVSFDEFWDDVVPRLVPRLGGSIERSLRRTAQQGVRLVVEEIDAAGAVDTGALRQSVGHRPIPGGAELSVDAPYAAIVEYGSRPHRPPTDPIAEWALRKGIASTPEEARSIAFAIANKIAKKGTKPKFFFKKALRKLRPIGRLEIKEGLKETAAIGWMGG